MRTMEEMESVPVGPWELAKDWMGFERSGVCLVPSNRIFQRSNGLINVALQGRIQCSIDSDSPGHAVLEGPRQELPSKQESS